MSDIKTITFMGDCHFNATTPRSRTDNFAETCIDKLYAVLDICKTKGYKHLVQLGDFFHTPSQPIGFLNQIIDVLQDFQNEGIQVYAIFGNHSLISNDLENGYKSALGLLFRTGLIKELRTELFSTKEGYTVALHGYHYPEGIKSMHTREVQANVNICVMHRYFEKKLFKNCLDRNQLSQLGYQVYVTGHDHQPYNTMKFDDFTLIRPGRLMRGTSDKYNLEDNTVYLDTIAFNGAKDEPKMTVIRDIVPTKLASQVFTILAQDKDKTGSTYLSNLSNRVTDLLNMMDESNTSSNNLYTVLDKLPIDIRIKDRVEHYLKQNGIYR